MPTIKKSSSFISAQAILFNICSAFLIGEEMKETILVKVRNYFNLSNILKIKFLLEEEWEGNNFYILEFPKYGR
jgi:hypothetical protein